jgi:hypothetical protein
MRRTQYPAHVLFFHFDVRPFIESLSQQAEKTFGSKAGQIGVALINIVELYYSQ